MKTASSRIWTRIANSIYYEVNHYAKHAYMYTYVCVCVCVCVCYACVCVCVCVCYVCICICVCVCYVCVCVCVCVCMRVFKHVYVNVQAWIHFSTCVCVSVCICACMCVCISIFLWMHVCIYLIPLSWAGCVTQGQFLNRVRLVWIQNFPSLRLVA